jgi:hypothetical protein
MRTRVRVVRRAVIRLAADFVIGVSAIRRPAGVERMAVRLVAWVRLALGLVLGIGFLDKVLSRYGG